MKVLVTGANGFVGRQLCQTLAQAGHDVVRCVRHQRHIDELARRVAGTQGVVVSDILDRDALTGGLRGIEAVVHLAARVHVMHETDRDPLAAYREVNVDGTRLLAECAAQCGVSRFIFMSSIKVNGEVTHGLPFCATDIPAPIDPYGISKHQAELRLAEVATSTGMTVTSIRSPLIYGPGVGGNFATLVNFVERGIPLPFAGVSNRRSLISVFNLTHLIERCLLADKPELTLVAADGGPLSTPELIRRIATALGTKARLFQLPAGMLRLLLGQSRSTRLLDDLEVDPSHTFEKLNWQPPYSVERALHISFGK